MSDDERITALNKRLDLLEQNVQERLGRLETRIENLKQRVDSLHRPELDQILKDAVDLVVDLAPLDPRTGKPAPSTPARDPV